MPSESLPKLPKPENFAEVQKAKPEAVEFMIKVEHELAPMLDMEPYNPETNEGFGCYACHTSK